MQLSEMECCRVVLETELDQLMFRLYRMLALDALCMGAAGEVSVESLRESSQVEISAKISDMFSSVRCFSSWMI